MEVVYIIQNRSITCEILYQNMMAMCQGFSGFRELENRPISEILYLMEIWKNTQTKPENDTGGMDSEYELITDPAILKEIRQ